jgi:hypothetical protein
VAAGRRQPAQGEGSRHEAREQAMALLYEAELKSLEPAMLLEALPATPDPFAVKLVKGVAGRRAQVDSLVAGTAVGWEIGRMPIVDHLRTARPTGHSRGGGDRRGGRVGEGVFDRRIRGLRERGPIPHRPSASPLSARRFENAAC